MRTYIKDLKSKIDEEVTIYGFLKRVRDMKDIIFLTVSDISGEVQIIVDKKEVDITKIKDISLESAIRLKGLVKAQERSKSGVEIIYQDIVLESLAEKILPIDFSGKSETSLETRLDSRFLDLRTKKMTMVFKVRTAFEQYIRDYLLAHSFIEIHSPKIIGVPSEGGAEVFEVNYFDDKAYLTQSPQFYKQMAMSSGFDKVFEIGDCFRADRSKTTYHATEFTALDVEISWLKDLDELLDFEEDMLKTTFKRLALSHAVEIEEIFGVKFEGLDLSFPRITLAEAIEIAKAEGYSKPEALHSDLDAESQHLIWQYLKKKSGSDFFFVTKWPAASRSFYHMRDSEGFSDSFDLIYKGVEITTGSLREHRLDILKSQLADKKIPEKGLEFYLDFFKYGCPPHGGFAIGLDRLAALILELSSIREAMYLYRGPNRIVP